MRISDWSSDGCASDLRIGLRQSGGSRQAGGLRQGRFRLRLRPTFHCKCRKMDGIDLSAARALPFAVARKLLARLERLPQGAAKSEVLFETDRASVGWGKSVPVRVTPGVRGSNK